MTRFDAPRRARARAFAAALILIPAVMMAAGSGARPGNTEVALDSLLVVARDLTGETGIGPPSRVGPRPSTAVYAEYLRDRLHRVLLPLGGGAMLESFTPEFDPPDTVTVRDPYTNVIGYVPGRLGDDAAAAFLLGAHFDATAMNTEGWDRWTDPAPGADDNASGVAALLEVARVMGERGLQPDADLYFVFFDGEELQGVGGPLRGLVGSTHLAESGFGPLYGVINLDMVAYNPRVDSLVVVTNPTSRWLANRLVDVHRAGAAPGLAHFDRVTQGLFNSDHAPFWTEGVDGVMVIEASGIPAHNPYYHRVTDTIANTYSRGGSQAARAAELVLGLVETWADPGPACLELTGEDILFQMDFLDTRIVDASVVRPGDPVELAVGVTNRGGSGDASWGVEVDLETMDGRFIETLGHQAGTAVLPAGARENFIFPWTPRDNQVGVVRARARVVVDAACGAVEATRTVAVKGDGSEVVRAYVYPNPTRDPGRAVLHYELAEEGAVRVTLIDVTGRELVERDFSYDPAVPDPEVDVGGADVVLEEILGGFTPAPGLYLVRVELFRNDGGGSADVAIAKMAVLR